MFLLRYSFCLAFRFKYDVRCFRKEKYVWEFEESFYSDKSNNWYLNRIFNNYVSLLLKQSKITHSIFISAEKLKSCTMRANFANKQAQLIKTLNEVFNLPLKKYYVKDESVLLQCYNSKTINRILCVILNARKIINSEQKFELLTFVSK